MLTRKQYVLLISLLFWVLLFLQTASYAITQNTLLIGAHELSEDLEIIIPAGTQWQSDSSALGAITTRSSDETVHAGSGIQVSIDIVRPVSLDTPGNLKPVNYGILNMGGTVSIDKLYITAGRGVDFTSSSGDVSSTGIYSSSGNVTIGDTAKIYSLGNGAALNATNNGSISVGNGAVLYGNVSGQSSGVVMTSASSNVGKITIGNNAVISNDGYSREGGSSAAGSSGYHIAVNASHGGNITIGDNTRISAYGSGNNNYAVMAGFYMATDPANTSTGIVVIGNGAEIVASADFRGHGLFAANKGSLIRAGDNLSVTTYGNLNAGILAYRGSTIEIGSRADILTNNQTAYGLYADNSKISAGDGLTIETLGDSAPGVIALVSGMEDVTSEITLGKNSKISTVGSNSYGISALNRGAIITLGAESFITTTGTNAIGVGAVNGGVVRMDGAAISISGVTSSDIPGTEENAAGLALYAENINSEDESLVTGDGKFTINGDIAARASSSGRSLIDITMTDDSAFTGATYVVGENASINLVINGQDSRWDLTENSVLTNLTLNGAVVDFGGSQYVTMSVYNLNANNADSGGTFIMRADPARGASDQLKVTGTAAGSHKIHVLNSGSAVTTGNEVITLVDMASVQNATFSLTNAVELGGWLYGLRQNYDDWELYGIGALNNVASAAVGTFSASYLMSYAEMNTLTQRLGDLRAAPHLSGLWLRAYGGKFESNFRSYIKPFDMKYGGVQIGYDRKYNTDDAVYGGVMFGYGKGDLDYSNGSSGGIDSKMLGLYMTFVKQSGFYMDATLKYQWMNNDFKSLDSANTIVNGGDINIGGIGASMEVGQRIPLGGALKSGWYVEPQIQLSYMRQDGGYFNASNGLRIGVEPFTSILGRLGALIGYETAKTNFYAKVSKVKEFDGDMAFYSNGVAVPESMRGSWWVYGVGFTSKLNGTNSIYLDLERTSGSAFTQPWIVKAGYRVEF